MKAVLRLAATLSVVALVAAGPLSAQTIEKVYPLEPPDGGTVGLKPILRIGVDGTDLGKMRFRIELSRDDFDTVAYTFDQMKSDAGWAFTGLGGENGAMYRVKQPLKDGDYVWRVSVWNGVDWVRGKTVATMHVDGTPPADVDGLRIEINRERGTVSLSWAPVATDRDGGPERVRLYHIYRYQKKTFFFVIRPFEIGTSETTSFEDTTVKDLANTLIFYRITAEDEAGNEPDRRY